MKLSNKVNWVYVSTVKELVLANGTAGRRFLAGGNALHSVGVSLKGLKIKLLSSQG